ncbi:MAG TPA: TetR/AcrR family transcriptional regulator [Burkholderiaceae bacterium]|nr:TetR/AcrR family transcriptional regulator [Burkholderiaceae bacterium]
MVTSAPGSRRERKKANVRQRILDAAVRLFGAHGIDAVTVDAIAEAADVGKGTIYNHYQTKEDIVVAFMVAMEAQVQKRAAVADARAPAATVLTRFLQRQFKPKEPHHRFVRVFLGEMLAHTEQFLPAMVAMQRVADPPLHELFTRLRARGAIRGDVPAPQFVLALKTLHLGLTALWAVEGPPFRNTYRTLRLLAQLFGDGLQPRREQTRRKRP